MSRLSWLLSHPEFRKNPIRVSSGLVFWEIHKLLSQNMSLELDGLKLTEAYKFYLFDGRRPAPLSGSALNAFALHESAVPRLMAKFSSHHETPVARGLDQAPG
jgi:hypothetical protein